MAITLVAMPDGPPPNGTWKWDLPVWAVLQLGRRFPGWRGRYLSAGLGLAHAGFVVVTLTDCRVIPLVKER